MWNYIFVIGSYLFSIFHSLQSTSYRSKKNRDLYWFVIFALILFVTFRDGSSLNDYDGYVSLYSSVNRIVIEPAFLLIREVARSGGNIYLMFFLYALIGIGTKGIAINNITQLKFLTLCVYISNILILHDMTQMRAGVASGLFLLALPYLKDRKILKYITLISIATLFHYSAILFLFCCIFWVKKLATNKVFLWSIIPLGYLLGGTIVDPSLIPFEPLRLKLEMYQKLNESGTDGYTSLNLFNPYIIFRIILYYIILWKSSLIINKTPYFNVLIFIESIAIFVFPFLSFIPILGYRGSELLGVVEILLYPLMIYCFKPRLYGKICVIGISLLLLIVNLTYKALIKI